jgi:hypothetical protein
MSRSEAARLAAWERLSQAERDRAWKKAEKEERKLVRKRAEQFAKASVAGSTGAAYGKIWARWQGFVAARGRPCLPPRLKDVEAYLMLELAPKRSVAVLDGFSAAMSWFCGRAGFDSCAARNEK